MSRLNPWKRVQIVGCWQRNIEFKALWKPSTELVVFGRHCPAERKKFQSSVGNLASLTKPPTTRCNVYVDSKLKKQHLSSTSTSGTNAKHGRDLATQHLSRTDFLNPRLSDRLLSEEKYLCTHCVRQVQNLVV